MSHPEESSRRRGLLGGAGRLLAGLAIAVCICLAGGCVKVNVGKGAVKVPGFTWPPEDGEQNDKPDNPDQLP